MKVLDDLISTLDFNTQVKDIRQGIFHTGVLTRHCGLAATLPRDALKQQGPLVENPGFLMDKTPEVLVRMVYSNSILEAAIGMAGINSLLDLKMEKCVELNAADVILEKGKGRNVAIVGHFPFLARIREQAKNLWVIEKNPQKGDFGEAEAERWIPNANVVAITGTALTNHTLAHLLSLCDPLAYVVMLGDSVPLSPVLFDYNVDAIAGTRVVDTETALRCVSQGANFRQIKGVKRLSMFKNGRT
jgi:uncharacterized protein (DUF4213/DUF364 family)